MVLRATQRRSYFLKVLSEIEQSFELHRKEELLKQDEDDESANLLFKSTNSTKY